MRNSVAKKLRKQSGNQQSTSNKLEYEYLKKEHMKTEVFPNIKRSKRQLRIGKVWKTKTTVDLPPNRKDMGKQLSKLKG